MQQIKECVLFLFDTETGTVGTGFLIGCSHPELNGRHIPYVVTAKHVVDGKSKIIGRYSHKVGAIVQVEYDLDRAKRMNDYWEHPDPGVDIVVFRTLSYNDALMRTIPQDLIASKDIYQMEDIKETDRVLFPGLLVNFMGESGNYPVTRSGNIALIPKESVPLKIPYGETIVDTRQDVFFVDGTVLPGSSGSPVFLYPGPRLVKDKMKSIGSFRAWLLGIVHGFYPAVPREIEEITSTSNRYGFRENSGIAIVFPSWRILEILESKQFTSRLNKLARAEKK